MWKKTTTKKSNPPGEAALRESVAGLRGRLARSTQPSLRGRALRLLARRDWSRAALRTRLLAEAPAQRIRPGGGGGGLDGSFMAAADAGAAETEATKGMGKPDAAAVDALLDEFAARGWLSDQRYAQALVEKRSARNGRAVIAQQLKRAGIADSEAGEALALLDGEQEYQAALALWRRKFGAAPADQKERARQMRFLLQRGYAMALAQRVLKQGPREIQDD